MRKLKTKDVVSFARCLTQLGLKEELANIAKDAEEGRVDNFRAGFEIIWGIIEKASEKGTAHLIYETLAGPFECTAKDVEEMDFQDLIANCKQLAEENNLVAFFKSAAVSMT